MSPCPCIGRELSQTFFAHDFFRFRIDEQIFPNVMIFLSLLMSLFMVKQKLCSLDIALSQKSVDTAGNRLLLDEGGSPRFTPFFLGHYLLILYQAWIRSKVKTIVQIFAQSLELTLIHSLCAPEMWFWIRHPPIKEKRATSYLEQQKMKCSCVPQQ